MLALGLANAIFEKKTKTNIAYTHKIIRFHLCNMCVFINLFKVVAVVRCDPICDRGQFSSEYANRKHVLYVEELKI